MIDQDATKNRQIRLPKKAEKVKNKAAAQVQITAEQLLREAKERELEIAPPPPRVRITDPDELAEYHRKKRKEFEDNIRKNRLNIPNWIKYAKFEESIGEIQRARSVFERTLDVDHRSISVYIQYAEMEMRWALRLLNIFIFLSGTHLEISRLIMQETYGIGRSPFFRWLRNFGSSSHIWKS